MSWRRAGRALLGVALVAAGARAFAVGCDDGGSHIYSGEQYNSGLGCLDPVSSMDIVSGPEPGSCAPVCILSRAPGAAEVAYVSTLCAPYPGYPYELDAGSDPLCVAALDAFRRDALCIDGGVVVPPSDAAAEGGGDAGGSAPGDAAVDASGD